MPRPKADPDQQLRAYDLYRRGLGPKAIVTKLECELVKPVHIATVNRWIKHFKSMPEATEWLDGPYKWQQLDEYGIPWEASEVLFGVWEWIVELQGTIKQANDRMRSTGHEWKYLSADLLTPTARQARWWWRVHCANPTLEPEEIWRFGFECALREERKDLFGGDLDLSDVEGAARVSAWDAGHQKAYQQHVREGMIPPMKTTSTTWAVQVASSAVRQSKDMPRGSYTGNG